MSKVLGVLGGRDGPSTLLAAWGQSADLVYAADGAGDACIAAGLDPVVVGDLDSFKGSLAGRRVVRIEEQESSDCDKMLRVIEAEGYREVVVAGIEGDRLDHVLASLGSLAACPMGVTLLLRRGLGKVVRGGGRLEVEAKGCRMSLIPIVPALVSIEGVEWPVKSARLALGGAVSLSNRSLGVTTVEVQEGVGLVTVECDLEPWTFPWVGTH